MIETPSIAIKIDKISKIFELLSIGINDLMQYTIIFDRINE